MKRLVLHSWVMDRLVFHSRMLYGVVLDWIVFCEEELSRVFFVPSLRMIIVSSVMVDRRNIIMIIGLEIIIKITIFCTKLTILFNLVINIKISCISWFTHLSISFLNFTNLSLMLENLSLLLSQFFHFFSVKLPLIFFCSSFKERLNFKQVTVELKFFFIHIEMFMTELLPFLIGLLLLLMNLSFFLRQITVVFPMSIVGLERGVRVFFIIIILQMVMAIAMV